MAITFKELRKLQGERVKMQFDDGSEVLALLLCATKDIDGSKHLIYDKIESVPREQAGGAEIQRCFYADAKSLVDIEAADARRAARSLRGWETFVVRPEGDQVPPKTWRPSA